MSEPGLVQLTRATLLVSVLPRDVAELVELAAADRTYGPDVDLAFAQIARLYDDRVRGSDVHRVIEVEPCDLGDEDADAFAGLSLEPDRALCD